MSNIPILIAGSSRTTRTFFHQIFFCICFLFLTFGIVSIQGQDVDRPLIYSSLEQMDASMGKVEIIQPVQVENLLKMQIANDKQQNGIPGYRVRIFSQSGQTARQKANDTRAAFMRSFPQTEAYLEYNDPNFQIVVGNYRTKTEAMNQYKQIAKMFPNAFIVSEIIKIPK